VKAAFVESEKCTILLCARVSVCVGFCSLQTDAAYYELAGETGIIIGYCHKLYPCLTLYYITS